MKKIIFVFLIIFTIYSFTNEDPGFEPMSQKEVMKSWAWKILVFIDEGEMHPHKPIQKSLYKNNNERIYEDDFFLNNEELTIKDEAVRIFEKATTEK